MRKSLIVNLCMVSTLALAVWVRAETYWAKSYGGPYDDRARSIQQTADGGLILTGSTGSSVENDFLVLKLDSGGEFQWMRTYGALRIEDFSDDNGWSIQQTMDGGYIVAGSTGGSTTAFVSLWVLKLDGLGNVTWQKAYNEDTGWDSARSIRQSSDGGYVVLGTTELSGDDLWVLKLDSLGEIVWQKTFGRSLRDFAAQIEPTLDGGYIVAGSSEAAHWEFWYWVLKLNGLGEIEWEKAYWGGEDSRASCIQKTLDGGYIIAGEKGVTGTADSDCWLLKLDGLGEIEWEKAYGGSLHDACYGIRQTRDGGYIVAGATESFGAGKRDAWVFKLDSLGGIEWQQAYGGSDRDWAYSLQQTSEDDYIVAGGTESFGAGGYDVWVLKLDSQGAIPSCCLMTSGSVEIKNVFALEVSTDSTVVSPEAAVSEVGLSMGSDSPTVSDACEGSCRGWGPASHLETEAPVPSRAVNHLFMTIGSIGVVLLWKRRRRGLSGPGGFDAGFKTGVSS